jgi:hypothetical protein
MSHETRLSLSIISIQKQIKEFEKFIRARRDIYSTDELDALLGQLAPQLSTYTEDEIDGQTYTRSQVDTIMSTLSLASTVTAIQTSVASNDSDLDIVGPEVENLTAFKTHKFVLRERSTTDGQVPLSDYFNYPYGSAQNRTFRYMGYKRLTAEINTFTDIPLGSISEYPIVPGARAIHVRMTFKSSKTDITDENERPLGRLGFAYKLKTQSAYSVYSAYQTWYEVINSTFNERERTPDNVKGSLGVLTLEWVFRLDASAFNATRGELSLFDSGGNFNAHDYDIGFKFLLKAASNTSEFDVNSIMDTNDPIPPVASITSFA